MWGMEGNGEKRVIKEKWKEEILWLSSTHGVLGSGGCNEARANFWFVKTFYIIQAHSKGPTQPSATMGGEAVCLFDHTVCVEGDDIPCRMLMQLSLSWIYLQRVFLWLLPKWDNIITVTTVGLIFVTKAISLDITLTVNLQHLQFNIF